MPDTTTLPWNQNNIRKGVVPNKPGIYTFFDGNRQPIYVGVAGKLRHRLQSYYQDDDYKAHPTKRNLRGNIRYVKYTTLPISQARVIEHKIKKETKYNYL